MRWLRSWPAVVPPGRAYIQDEIERLVISDYDYTPLGAIDEDVCLLEWDMALDREDMERFEQLATTWRSGVIVAPYRLYVGHPQPVWAHRRIDEVGKERWITYWERTVDYFSFGCIYLPRALVRAFLAAPAPQRGRSPFLAPDRAYHDMRFNDQTFSVWHRHYYAGPSIVGVAWEVRPIHLHW